MMKGELKLKSCKKEGKLMPFSFRRGVFLYSNELNDYTYASLSSTSYNLFINVIRVLQIRINESKGKYPLNKDMLILKKNVKEILGIQKQHRTRIEINNIITKGFEEINEISCLHANENGEYEKLKPFIKLEMDCNLEHLLVLVNPLRVDMLLSPNKNFSTIDMFVFMNTLNLSIYAKRLYVRLMRYKTNGFFKTKESILKDMLMTCEDRNRRYESYFKTFVLDKAIKELNDKKIFVNLMYEIIPMYLNDSMVNITFAPIPNDLLGEELEEFNDYQIKAQRERQIKYAKESAEQKEFEPTPDEAYLAWGDSLYDDLPFC